MFSRKGTVMCRDSVKDEWIYIVKQGVCRILKTIKIDSKTDDHNTMYIELKKLYAKDVFVS